jgi:hypothetical protein
VKENKMNEEKINVKEFRWMVDFISKHYSTDLDKIKYKLGLSRVEIVAILASHDNDLIRPNINEDVRNSFKIYYIFEYARQNPGDIPFGEIFNNYMEDFDVFPKFIEAIGDEYEARFLSNVAGNYSEYLLPFSVCEKIKKTFGED